MARARVRLQEARYKKGWSQAEAADQMGVTRNSYQRWERGKSTPYPIHRYRLCEVYGVTAEALGFKWKRKR